MTDIYNNNMWQSQVENEHYSYQFYTTFQNLQCRNSVIYDLIKVKFNFHNLLSFHEPTTNF